MIPAEVNDKMFKKESTETIAMIIIRGFTCEWFRCKAKYILKIDRLFYPLNMKLQEEY